MGAVQNYGKDLASKAGNAIGNAVNNVKNAKADKKKVIATLCYDAHYLPQKLAIPFRKSPLPLECTPLYAADLPKAFTDSNPNSQVTGEKLKEHLLKKLCATGKNGKIRKEYCPGFTPPNGSKIELSNWVLSDDQRDPAAGSAGSGGSYLERCPAPTYLDEQTQHARSTEVVGVGLEQGETWRLTLFQKESTLVWFHPTSYGQTDFVDIFLPVGSMTQAVAVIAQQILVGEHKSVRGLPANNQPGWVENVFEAPFLFGLAALKEYTPKVKAWNQRTDSQDPDWNGNAANSYLGIFGGKWPTIEWAYRARHDPAVPGLYFGPTGLMVNGYQNPDLPSNAFSNALIFPEQQFQNNQPNAQQIATLRQRFAQEAKKLNVCVAPVAQDQNQNGGGLFAPKVQAVNQFQNNMGGWGF